MEEIMLGTHIKNRREVLGLSQEELAEGLCSVSNLSRIENNEQVPSRNTAKDLLERLGLADDLLCTMVSQKETAVRALIREIHNDMIRCRRMPAEEKPQTREEIQKKLTKLEKSVKRQDYTARQFLLANRACLGNSEGPYSVGERLAMQLEAIRLTHASFNPEDFLHNRYTMAESRLICQIANSYSALGERKRAIDMYGQLLKYMEKNNQQLAGYAGQFCLIAHNYVIDLTQEERYREAIEIAEQGRTTGIYYGHHQFLPAFIATQAECWHFLGDDAKSKSLYCQAYYTYKTFEDAANVKNIEKEMREYLGIEILILE